jgi:S-formylglutathione hydrolase
MSGAALSVRGEQRSFDGLQGFYEHDSALCGGPMRFAVYLPPAALRGEQVPALYYLAGLTCTEETFVIKGGAQRIAAELGLILVSCDTSPRTARIPGDADAWDFGQGAGFYVDATEAPWSGSYLMRSYVTRELRDLVEQQFPVRPGARGIFGHSMGGHGALSIALGLPDEYRSVSAFAPIVAPSQVPWGIKAFGRYLGKDRARWAQYDAVELVGLGSKASGSSGQKSAKPPFEGTFLVDQGTADQFLQRELRPELFERACEQAGQPLDLRRREGYDHSYFFISTFMETHLRHHARALGH